MTETELIAKQALRIEELEENLRDRDARLKNIHMKLVCIGGPLNDNVLQFNPRQINLMQQIDYETETS